MKLALDVTLMLLCKECGYFMDIEEKDLGYQHECCGKEMNIILCFENEEKDDGKKLG